LFTYYTDNFGNSADKYANRVSFSEKYAFVNNEGGITRIDIETDSTENFNRTKTNSSLGNSIYLSSTNKDGNFWGMVKVSKRRHFEGVFPLVKYELKKYDKLAMIQLATHQLDNDVEYFDAKSMTMSSRYDAVLPNR
jgi:hypothetical protein